MSWAARLLALMLLLFEGFVEIPPIFVRLHNQATWGAAVYNVAAIGACWVFAEFLTNPAALVGTRHVPDATSGGYQLNVARISNEATPS